MVNYDFDVNAYRGSSITNQEWPAMSARAQDQLNHYKRIYTVVAPEENSEAMAVCAIAEVITSSAAAQSGAGAVTSASIGSVSVSYGGVSTLDLSPKGQARELYNAARRYLDIYRG